MKQNERLLVYAVTGFLALILVVAVFFGDTPKAEKPGRGAGGTSLSDILNGEQQPPASAVGAAGAGVGEASSTGLSGPVAATFEQPLRVQAPSPATLVRQKLGPYRKDRAYRVVQATANDGWGTLAERWMGDVGCAEEIECLNEDTRILREGQNVIVPWVDDETLLESLAASDAPTLLAGDPQPSLAAAGVPSPAEPSFAAPAVVSGGSVTPAAAPAATPVAAVLYEIQDGDSLWKILAKRFESRQVPKMIERTKELNPGVDVERLRVGKKIKLPKAAE